MILLLLQACFLLNDLGLAPADSALLAAESATVTADPVCSAYLTCVAAVDPGELGALADSYGESGSCWGDEATAEACAAACDAELDVLREENPDEPECGGTVPRDEWPFRAGPWYAQIRGVLEDPCDTMSDDAIEAMADWFDEYDVSLSTDADPFPVFHVALGTEDLECVLDGQDYACANAQGDLAMGGRFAGETHATAALINTSGEACYTSIALALTAKE